MLANNLKYLRKQRSWSQQELADRVGISRSTVAGYETNHNEPNIAMLIKLSALLNVSLDTLVKYDLSKLEAHTSSARISANVLAISVDSTQRENIELVDTKAAAGYADQFQDIEFIRDLPKMVIPGLTGGTFRAFELEGNSMPPFESGDLVICRYTEHLSELKSGQKYVIVLEDRGLVFKRIYTESSNVIAVSDNPEYPPFLIAPEEELNELWEQVAFVRWQ